MTVALAWIARQATKKAAEDVKLALHKAAITEALATDATGNRLRAKAAVLRRLANRTRDVADMDAADLAERLLDEHEQRQAP